MPGNSRRPFGRNTLKLHAAFVPDGAEDKPSRADIVAAVGARPLKIAAALVPPGGRKPGHPYVPVGEFEFTPDEADATMQAASGTAPPLPPAQGPASSR